MQSESIKTLGFLGRPQQCVLPIFQRKYSWVKNVECKKLFENLVTIGESEKNSWYLGAIVCQNKGGNLARPVLVLIDGQQRMTTIAILICAITDYLRKHPRTKLDEVKNWDSMLKTYVINSEEEGEKWYRLLLNNEDKEDLKELIYKTSVGEDIPKHKGESKIFNNYYWFKRNINKNNIQSLYNGLRKLEMIHISLDEHDVAQNIFETLNATGRSLTKTDQIRNYMLMGMDYDVSEELYHHYWRPMELSFEKSSLKDSSYHLDLFMRYYLMMKLHSSIRTDDVYEKFRLVSDNFENTKESVKELAEFSKYYLIINANESEDPHMKKELGDFQFIRIKIMSPFLLGLYKRYADDTMTKDDFFKILNVIKSYSVRRSLCGGIGNTGLDNVAVQLSRTIEHGHYAEVVSLLTGLRGYSRFISDELVRETIPFQNFSSFKQKHFILSKLCNYNRSVSLDTSSLEVVQLCDDVSDEYKGKLGNFSLENIDLCMDIQAESNEEFIDKRTEKLTELILKVWEYPSL